MTGDDKLPEEDIERWTKSLLSEIEEKDRQQVKMDFIQKRANEMDISFEKFSPEEFYATVLMLYTDFSKALPAQPIDTYLKWLRLGCVTQMRLCVMARNSLLIMKKS